MKRFGLLAATLGLAATLSVPAMARDHDDYRYRNGYYNNGYNGLTEHQRHELQKQQERIAREERRAAERAQRNGYYNNYRNPYNAGRSNGYYDRFGNFHPTTQGFYDRWGVYHR